MGITGLIPFLKKASRPVNVKEFSGYVAAVDVYCWLHKGVYSCADRLVRGEKTDGYVHYCVKMVNVLLSMNVTPILVFDGRRLPAKADVEKNRREQREKNKKKGTSLLREGKLKEAHEYFKRAVDVTPEMALQVIQACRRINVDCIVAPYEADAQLAYLSKSGIADIIITEDSDLVLFGCEKIIFKMDCNGYGVLVDQSRLHVCMNVNAANFSFEKFRRMCIMSGCDYLPSLPGIGLAKACKFFVSVTNTNLNIILRKIPSYLRMPQLSVSTKYVEDFMKAENTFLHQLAFDPRSRVLLPLNPYPENTDPLSMDYAGEYLPNDIAYEMAKGNIDLHTMKTVDNFEPTQEELLTRRNSIWSARYTKRKPITNDNVNEIDHQSTKGKEIVVKTKIICRKIQRTLDEKEEKNDEDILNLYRSSPVKKKSKLDVDDVCYGCDDVIKTYSKTSTENTLLNQVLSATTNKKNKFSIKPEGEQVKKCVRSRFFNESSSQKSSKVLDWFDEIANEYNNGTTSATVTNNNSPNESFWDKIENPITSEKNDLTVIKPTEKENIAVDVDIPCTPTSQSNFAWQKLRKFSFGKTDIPIHSTPVSWAPYKSPGIIKRKFSLESSQASECSETINSIDNDSFNLSQMTRDSACSQGESRDNVDNSQTSCQSQSRESSLHEIIDLETEDKAKEFSLKSVTSVTAKKLGTCRRSGLCKKPKVTRDKNQTSITEALSKFHYMKVKSKSLSTIMG